MCLEIFGILFKAPALGDSDLCENFSLPFLSHFSPQNVGKKLENVTQEYTDDPENKAANTNYNICKKMIFWDLTPN